MKYIIEPSSNGNWYCYCSNSSGECIVVSPNDSKECPGQCGVVK